MAGGLFLRHFGLPGHDDQKLTAPGRRDLVPALALGIGGNAYVFALDAHPASSRRGTVNRGRGDM